MLWLQLIESTTLLNSNAMTSQKSNAHPTGVSWYCEKPLNPELSNFYSPFKIICKCRTARRSFLKRS